MTEKFERNLSEVESDLEQEPEEAQETKPKKVKKVAKKAKKVEKVEKKASKKSEDSDKVTLADLASQAGITTASARRKLRDAELSKEGRWEWEDGSKALKEACKALGLDE